MAQAAPTSSFLEGSVAVGLVIVEGPGTALRFTEEERTKVVAEVQNGLTWLAGQNPAAGVNFTYDIKAVTLNVTADPTVADLEGRWRDPAMAALGFPGSWSGVLAYVESLRTRFTTRWTYCAFFTKYPLSHFAYASIGGPRLVMDYANDGWGPENIDRVFAHESGHIFGCPDEYASSNCNCGGSWGRFEKPNLNCELCAPGGGVTCLMRYNDWTMCDVTPPHLGWHPYYRFLGRWNNSNAQGKITSMNVIPLDYSHAQIRLAYADLGEKAVNADWDDAAKALGGDTTLFGPPDAEGRRLAIESKFTISNVDPVALTMAVANRQGPRQTGTGGGVFRPPPNPTYTDTFRRISV